MIVNVNGVGIWAQGIDNWHTFRAMSPVSDSDLPAGEATKPPADIIPPREKRRVPMITRIAIEAATQACEMASVDPAEPATVFASCMGDTDVTDYMCRALATPEKVMSPTRFHNSVHNATAGYWSIFAKARHSGGFIGAFHDSFAMGLIEAATLTLTEDRPALLVMYDIASSNPMHEVCPVDTPLAYALLLQAGNSSQGRQLNLQLTNGQSQGGPTAAPLFNTAGHQNPSGNGLALLKALAQGSATQLVFPFGAANTLIVNAGEQLAASG